ncbi:acyl-CoA dehydrogenase family protein [Providencia sp. PROV188]|jgi:alkylation response protein AidB-like acyl-CoA dehydrogenase|uniref:acyl-CoA dehydrogenase family protein n=1 Tax=Providencia TaxID=586 RepID=UPI0003E1C7F2|nr:MULTISPECIES: acyl-CoA dehydrogenase family protein [Providencia]ETS98361.1 acyl-CoA dehydrogenase, C-terminal domain protein [Providencia alcalifaciens PAL-3]EUC97965.1 acyl-CoA dehydrogenase, C-terminal domain protein [Providencia alcalifaciens PAL-1]MBG5883202.1 acyl-CoA dehydrogenase family protein [Providencia alcalifaciens]MDR2243499.1 acyl-CoA dehydrogenase family protein [Providencia alcalifaciens]MTB45535.1 acyl-CoA dehydrogenase [Providencia sp. wls1950]
MSFDINETEYAIVEAVEKVCRDILQANAQRYDEEEIFCAESLTALGEMGCWGINLPEQYGGFGIGSIAMSMIVEAVAAACASTSSALTAHFLATDSILIGGTEEQKNYWLPKAASGELLGAFGLTEPAAGSNPADMRTTATRENGGWRIRGNKHYITNAKEADFIVLYAKTDVEAGARGISAFMIPKGTEGVAFSHPEKTMGLRGSTIYELALNCWLPESALLGEEGKGFHTAMEVLDKGRVEVAATSLGIARAAMESTLGWVKERQIGKKPLAAYQGTQWKIADMHTQLEAARMLTWNAAELRDSGQRFSLQSATAKLFAAECAGFVTDAALQLHGGYGYIRDLPLERYVRDARILRIFEGTSEIQKIIISRAVLDA